jgi:gas vesicle protein
MGVDILTRLRRELPDTDKDRYDIAYEQGAHQARSGLLFGGMVVGGLAGAAAMFLLDPARGAGRRAQLASRAAGFRNDLARTTAGKGEDPQNRARGGAVEHGVTKPNGGSSKKSTSGRENGGSQSGSRDGEKRQTASTKSG